MRKARRSGSVLSVIGVVLVALVPAAPAWADGTSAPPDGQLADANAWIKNRPRRTEVELVDTSKWDVGGVVVPAVQFPIYLTDPFHADRVGGGSSAPTGYALEWRIGWSVGRLSFEPLGGVSKVTGSAIPLRDGSTRESSLSRRYIGMQIRYTYPFERISPFFAAGGTYDAFSSPLLVRNANQAARVDGEGTPSVQARAGVFIRIAPLAEFATAFFEGGASMNYTFEGKIFDEGQLAIAPYLGLSLMGSVSPQKRPTTRSFVEPARDANEQARADAPRVEQDCDRGNIRSCEALIRFWYGQTQLSQTSVVAGVDALTRTTVGIAAPSLDVGSSQQRLIAGWLLYEGAAYTEAKQTADQPGYEAYLARFPHGEHALAARQALVDLRFAPIADAATRSKSVRLVLDYLEQNPVAAGPKNFVVQRGVAGLPGEDLDRLAALDPASDPRFQRLAEAALDERDNRALDEIAKLPEEKQAEALHTFAEQHPRSKRLSDARRLEEDRDFSAAQAKSGDEGIVALTRFRERYPSSTRVAEAARREQNLVYMQAVSSTNTAPMWRFLDRYPADAQASEVRERLANLLSSKTSNEPLADYEKFLERFADDPKKEAVSQRLKALRAKK